MEEERMSIKQDAPADAAPLAAEPSLDAETLSPAQAAAPVEEESAAGDAEGEVIDYERLAAEDLAEIKRLDPTFAPAAHLSELPFARRYAQLRDMGLSVTEALAAAYPRFERADGRRHLRAIAPRGSRAPADTLSHDGMKEAKSLFVGLSESEINALYRRVRAKNDI